MDTSIFFVVRRDNPDSEPVVVCEIYRESGAVGNLVASHVMTIEGARIRMHDLEAAIAQATEQREPKLHCRTCGSDAHNVDDCPEEVSVYAVKVDGEDYQLVARDLDELRNKIGTVESFGQCRDCGSFGKDGEPVGYFMLGQTTGDNTPVYAVCQGCLRKYLVVSRPSKEVCF